MALKIVLIEDDAEQNLSWQGIFALLDVQCQPFLLGSSALVHDYTGVDAIISDFNLADTNGVDLIRRVRTRFPNIPALIISASRSAYILKVAATIPNCKVLFKPIDISAMENFLSSLATVTP